MLGTAALIFVAFASGRASHNPITAPLDYRRPPPVAVFRIATKCSPLPFESRARTRSAIASGFWKGVHSVWRKREPGQHRPAGQRRRGNLYHHFPTRDELLGLFIGERWRSWSRQSGISGSDRCRKRSQKTGGHPHYRFKLGQNLFEGRKALISTEAALRTRADTEEFE
jgi:hypothetical protein